ncbi:receptor-like protein kinase ANXUR1 [Tanacetum coccineum]
MSSHYETVYKGEIRNLGENPVSKVPVRKISSSSIFLDTNWEAKVSHTYDTTESDSENRISRYVMTEKAAIYTLGIVLFEVLCGRLAFDTEYDCDSQDLIKLALKRHKEQNLDEIIDPFLKNQMAPDSLRYFADIAYRCCREDGNHPHIDSILWALERSFHMPTIDVSF